MPASLSLRECPLGISRRRFLAGTAAAVAVGPSFALSAGIVSAPAPGGLLAATTAARQAIAAGEIGSLLEVCGMLHTTVRPSRGVFWAACRDQLALLACLAEEPSTCSARLVDASGRLARDLSRAAHLQAAYRTAGGAAILLSAKPASAGALSLQIFIRGSRGTIRIDAADEAAAALMPLPGWSRRRAGQPWLPLAAAESPIAPLAPSGSTGRAMLAAALRSHRTQAAAAV
jgi:hypothetical protein